MMMMMFYVRILRIFVTEIDLSLSAAHTITLQWFPVITNFLTWRLLLEFPSSSILEQHNRLYLLTFITFISCWWINIDKNESVFLFWFTSLVDLIWWIGPLLWPCFCCFCCCYSILLLLFYPIRSSWARREHQPDWDYYKLAFPSALHQPSPPTPRPHHHPHASPSDQIVIICTSESEQTTTVHGLGWSTAPPCVRVCSAGFPLWNILGAVNKYLSRTICEFAPFANPPQHTPTTTAAAAANNIVQVRRGAITGAREPPAEPSPSAGE